MKPFFLLFLFFYIVIGEPNSYYILELNFTVNPLVLDTDGDGIYDWSNVRTGYKPWPGPGGYWDSIDGIWTTTQSYELDSRPFFNFASDHTIYIEFIANSSCIVPCQPNNIQGTVFWTNLMYACGQFIPLYWELVLDSIKNQQYLNVYRNGECNLPSLQLATTWTVPNDWVSLYIQFNPFLAEPTINASVNGGTMQTFTVSPLCQVNSNKFMTLLAWSSSVGSFHKFSFNSTIYSPQIHTYNSTSLQVYINETVSIPFFVEDPDVWCTSMLLTINSPSSGSLLLNGVNLNESYIEITGNITEINSLLSSLQYMCQVEATDFFSITINDLGALQNNFKNSTDSIQISVIVLNPLTSSTAYISSIATKANSVSLLIIIIPIVIGVVCIICIVVIVTIVLKNRKKKPKESKNAALVELPDELEPHLDSFFKLLVKDKFQVAEAIITVLPLADHDSFAEEIVPLTEVSKGTTTFIEFLIQKEVNTANSSGSLLRLNSMTSKVIKVYSGLLGQAFLQTVLGSEIVLICQNPSHDGVSFEIDPEKLASSPENLEKNQQKLYETCKQILENIFNSLEATPFEFRSICYSLRTIVEKKFPDAGLIAVGGFLFLRYFCPAITSPVTYGLVKEQPNSQARRGLTLIAKTLQNLANGVNFGKKEPFMEIMNQFIQTYSSDCMKYFSSVSAIPSRNRNTKELKRIETSIQLKREHLEAILDLVVPNWPTLENQIKTTSFYEEISVVIQEHQKRKPENVKQQKKSNPKFLNTLRKSTEDD